MHVRMPETQLREMEVIAEAEGRHLSDTMRCLLRLGISEYHVTGTLYAVQPKRARSRKPSGEGEEHRVITRYLRKMLKAANDSVSKEDRLEQE